MPSVLRGSRAAVITNDLNPLLGWREPKLQPDCPNWPTWYTWQCLSGETTEQMGVQPDTSLWDQSLLNKIKCFAEYKTYCRPLDAADQQMPLFPGQKSTFISRVWLKFQKARQQCFFKGSFLPLWIFLSLQMIEHIPAISNWALFPWHWGFSGVEPRPCCPALAVKIKP